MPSKSLAQHNLMEYAAHDPEFAKKHHIPQEVAREFVAHDKGHYDELRRNADEHAKRGR
ncbi:TPA: hypothetical protein LU109_003569 [Enterobacter hormaechei subsp. xiangfangensis]|nr:hypothetical protein [Enterobacter hormaechei subsp. xiangfangensis]